MVSNIIDDALYQEALKGNWIVDSQYPKTYTVYYQGMFASQTQLARYVGPDGFIASTGERVKFVESPLELGQPLDIIPYPMIGPEIEELHTVLWTTNPLKLIVNTLFSGISRLSNWSYGIEVKPEQAQYGEHDNIIDVGTIAYHGIDLTKVSVAQENDIRSHQSKVEHCNAKLAKEKEQTCNTESNHIILHGVSRGAATTFNAAAANQYPNVKIVILEGCFDEALANQDRVTGVISGFFSQAKKQALKLGIADYRPEGPSPIKNIETFPEGVPVVFITSKKDNEVPYEGTELLAKALAKRGKNDVYLLTLDNPSHNDYISNNILDRRKYQSFIHAIYQKYQLPHKAQLAELGKPFLEESVLCQAELNAPLLSR